MKRIRRHIYYIEQIKKEDGVLKSVTSEDGSLFSGVYKTKIYPDDLPEWYKQDRYYKRQGYMSTQGIVDMVYIPSFHHKHIQTLNLGHQLLQTQHLYLLCLQVIYQLLVQYLEIA